MLFGTAAHEVLQGRDPETVATKHGLPKSSISELIDIRDRFFTSRNAVGAVYRELKFVADVEGQQSQGKVDQVEVGPSLKGNVVDFKTDAVKEGN